MCLNEGSRDYLWDDSESCDVHVKFRVEGYWSQNTLSIDRFRVISSSGLYLKNEHLLRDKS